MRYLEIQNLDDFRAGRIGAGHRAPSSLFDFASHDYLTGFELWYRIVAEGGWRSLGQNFSNYAPPYFYILYIVHRLAPALPTLYAVKLPGLFFDVLLCVGAAALVHAVTKSAVRSVGAGLVLFLAPTIFLNSALWGQTDSYYAAFCLLFVLAAMTDRPWLAMASLGIAVSFKLQSVFVFPFLMALWMTKKISWKMLWVPPAVYLLSLIPALLAGRPILDALTIYLGQAGYSETLTLNAPNLYAWMNYLPYGIVGPAAILLTVGVIGLYLYGVQYRATTYPRPRTFLLLAALSASLVPYFLPGMHERYFYLQDALAVIVAFCCPSLFFLPLLSVFSSLISYMPHLLLTVQTPPGLKEILPLYAYSWMNAIILVVLWRQVVADLFPSPARSSTGDDGSA